jgi:Protein of unknown function (DUF4230)
MLRKITRLIPLILIIIVAVLAWEKGKNIYEHWGENTTETDHHLIVQQIASLGKLELVKFRIKDVVESTIHKDILPDAKALVIVEGEVVGCLDLTKITVADLSTSSDTLVVHLPEPEVCNFKVDHSKSKVYDTEFALLDATKLMDNAYQEAELKIQESAKDMGIEEQTRKSAEQILKPFLEKVSNKKVILLYRIKDKKRELR